MKKIVLLCEGPRDEAVLCGMLARLGVQMSEPSQPWQAKEKQTYRWKKRPQQSRKMTRRLLQKYGKPPHKDGYRILSLFLEIWGSQGTPNETLLIALRDRDREQERCSALAWARQKLGDRFIGGCAIECLEAWVLIRLSLDGHPLNRPHQLPCHHAKTEVRNILGTDDNRQTLYDLFEDGYEFDALEQANFSQATGLAEFIQISLWNNVIEHDYLCFFQHSPRESRSCDLDQRRICHP